MMLLHVVFATCLYMVDFTVLCLCLLNITFWIKKFNVDVMRCKMRCYYLEGKRVSRTPKKPLHELRYGGEIYALSKDCETLMFLKARATLYKLVQYPEMLHIFFEGVTEWVFDRYLDEKAASKIVVGAEV